MKSVLSGVVFAVCAMAFGSAHASYVTYFGQDLNGNSAVPLSALPNSSFAQTKFLSAIVNPQVETLEGIAAGVSTPTLSFGATTATLSGNGAVVAVAPGTTDGTGRYSVPTGSSNFYSVDANATNRTFSLIFSQEIAAFGFYGIDIGDVGGSLILDFYNDMSQLLRTISVSSAMSSASNGSVLYMGVIAGTSDELFKTVTFRNLNGGGDGFGFDNFTVAAPSQVSLVPEPGSIALLGLGLAALVATSSHKRRGARSTAI